VQAGSTAVFLAVLVAATVSIVAGLLMPHTKAEDVAHGGPDAAPSDGEPDRESHREPDREPDLSADPVT
jgi:hypothetical protein